MGPIAKYEAFADWEAAYEICRARNQPMVVKVGTETARVWPNGEYQLLHSEQPDPEPADDQERPVRNDRS